MVVDRDLLLGQTRDFGCGSLRTRKHLRSHPNLASIGPDMYGAVHGLKRGMSQKRHLIDGLDFFGCLRETCLHVTFLARHGARFLRRLFEA